MTAAPVRLQLSRKRGFNLQAHSRAINGFEAVSVARPGKWGNPFRIGTPSGYRFNDGGEEPPMIESLTREQSLAFYRRLLDGSLCPEMHPDGHLWLDLFRKHFHHGGFPADMASYYLRNCNLACWCNSKDCCHADVLLELANR